MLMAGAMVALVSCDPSNNPEEGNASFEITVSDVKETTAHMAVKPSSNDAFYFYSVVESDTIARYESKEAYASDLIGEMKEYVDILLEAGYGELLGITSAKDLLTQGAQEYDITDLDPETKYSAFAFEVDTATFAIKGKVAVKEFTTIAIEKSANVITFVQDSDNKALIHINATNNDPYIWAYISKSDLTEYYDGSAIECMKDNIDYWNENYDLSKLISTGSEQWLTTSEITEPGTYVFIAAGLAGTVLTTDVFTQEIDVTQDMCGEEEIAVDAPRRVAKFNATPSYTKRFALK